MLNPVSHQFEVFQSVGVSLEVSLDPRQSSRSESVLLSTFFRKAAICFFFSGENLYDEPLELR